MIRRPPRQPSARREPEFYAYLNAGALIPVTISKNLKIRQCANSFGEFFALRIRSDNMTSPSSNRDEFVSRLGVLAATLASAVGLGNIWKFPALTGQNGGATFLFVYILATLLVGLPVMISEIMLGRKARANAVGTFRKLAPKGEPWWLIGISGVLAAFLIMGFYTNVAGWVFAYIFKALSGGIIATDPTAAEKAFGALISDPWTPLLWQWCVLALVTAVIVMGVASGIERATKALMPILLILLCVVCARSLALPKAGEGLAFLFMPDFSKLNGETILMALGLAFFKLSIGMGTMTTYGSYFRADQNIPLTATRVMACDLLISILAGLAIFPAAFNFGFTPTAGPSLLFMTIPAVFASMPGGHVFTVIFFVLSAIAATGAMLSLFEVPVAWMTEDFKMPRSRAAVLTAFGIALLGIPATLSMGVLGDVKFFGLNTFDLYDFASSNILLPVGGFFICLFAGWVWGREKTRELLSNGGALRNHFVASGYLTVVKYVSPVLVLLVLLKGLKII